MKNLKSVCWSQQSKLLCSLASSLGTVSHFKCWLTCNTLLTQGGRCCSQSNAMDRIQWPHWVSKELSVILYSSQGRHPISGKVSSQAPALTPKSNRSGTVYQSRAQRESARVIISSSEWMNQSGHWVRHGTLSLNKGTKLCVFLSSQTQTQLWAIGTLLSGSLDHAVGKVYTQRHTNSPMRWQGPFPFPEPCLLARGSHPRTWKL